METAPADSRNVLARLRRGRSSSCRAQPCHQRRESRASPAKPNAGLILVERPCRISRHLVRAHVHSPSRSRNLLAAPPAAVSSVVPTRHASVATPRGRRDAVRIPPGPAARPLRAPHSGAWRSEVSSPPVWFVVAVCGSRRRFGPTPDLRATPCSLMRVCPRTWSVVTSQGLRGSGSRLSKGSHADLRAGSTPAGFVGLPRPRTLILCRASPGQLAQSGDSPAADPGCFQPRHKWPNPGRT